MSIFVCAYTTIQRLRLSISAMGIGAPCPSLVGVRPSELAYHNSHKGGRPYDNQARDSLSRPLLFNFYKFLFKFPPLNALNCREKKSSVATSWNKHCDLSEHLLRPFGTSIATAWNIVRGFPQAAVANPVENRPAKRKWRKSAVSLSVLRPFGTNRPSISLTWTTHDVAAVSPIVRGIPAQPLPGHASHSQTGSIETFWNKASFPNRRNCDLWEHPGKRGPEHCDLSEHT